MGNSRLNYLDSAKGIGIILVIIGHSQYGGGLTVYTLGFYMPLFFFISGYIFKNSIIDISDLISKRAKQLLLPYFIYMVMLWGIYYIRCYFGDIPTPSLKHISVATLYSRYSLYPLTNNNNIFFLDMDKVFNSPLWFLTGMFVAYVIFVVLVKFINKYKIPAYFMILGCLIISIPFYHLKVLLPWSIDTAFLGAAYMLTAFSYKFEIKRIIEEGRFRKIFILTFLYILLCTYNSSANMSVKIFGARGDLSIFCYFATGCIGSILLLWICCKTKNFFIEKQFEIIGKYTMPIMAFHLIVLYHCCLILQKLPVQNSLIKRILCVMVAVVICYFIIFIKNIIVAVHKYIKSNMTVKHI